VPCVVAGGLNAGNVGAWIATGAEFIAAGRTIWNAGTSPEAALRDLASRL
jgi:thiamine monophosphate synthase